MRASPTSIWVLFVLFSVSTGSARAAQAPRGVESTLETILRPGMTVWITEADGQEERARIVGASGDIVTIDTGAGSRPLRTIDVVRVRARRSDPVINGGLIGAGAAVASGLFLCSLTETWANCRDDVGPMLRIAAIGAGAGIGIDALIRGRQTIYEAAPRSARLQAAPIVGGRAAGLQILLTF